VTGGARAAAIAGALAGIALAAAVLHARETAYPTAPTTERLLYLRSGKVADRLFLSFDALAADIYWIRAIQHYGRDLKDGTRPNRFELIEPLLDVTTTLDQHFLMAYRFGAVFLSLDQPSGLGRPDLAIRLLEKGLSADPDRWLLAYDIAFVHYFQTKDYAAAATWFERAVAMPGAPNWIQTLAVRTRAQGGDRQGARQMLAVLRDSPEEYLRREAERMLLQLDALDTIDRLEAQVEAFHQQSGRYPSSWQDLIAARMLPAVPVDSTGQPFVYNADLHRVVISPESRLSPLPKALPNR